MPSGNGTGPAGMGPMTGRAAGYCAGYPVPGYMNPAAGRFMYGVPYGYPAYGAFWPRGRGFGMGLGFGRGRGRGRGRFWW